MKEFKVNKYITLKLEGGKTNIYIKNELFNQCKFLLLDILVEKISSFDDIESIDEAAKRLDKTLEQDKTRIPPDTEFWGHCSNLQIWAENDYYTRLLHSNLSFPLLKRLAEIGDPLAKKVFKEEIAKRLSVLDVISNDVESSNYQPMVDLFYHEGYLEYLNDNELEIALRNTKEIDLGRCGPISFPKFTSENMNLKKLDLGLCKIKIPKEISNLKNLEILRLPRNNLVKIPKEIGSLKKLKSMEIYGNKITQIPESIGELSSLEYLNISCNKITKLPHSIGKLKNLKDLYLFDN